MLRHLLRAMRPAQWVKNLFVLGPLLFAYRITDPGAWAGSLAVFGAWCAVASGVYLLNDLADLEADRAHPEKRHRPLAAGDLPATVAVVAALLLLGGGLAASFALGLGVGALLAGYLGLNVLYTLALKRLVILDVMALSAGFVLRVLSGAWVLDVPASPWLLVCTGLLALFLGFAKRRQELAGADPEGTPPSRRVLESYTLPFLDLVETVLAASTAIAYTIYTVSPDTTAHVGDIRLLATTPFVLYGLLRYLWLVQVRGAGENPTRLALGDPGLLVTVVLWVGASGLLLYLGP